MIEAVRERLIEAVRVRLRADVPVGIYLSGGLDSSAVAGITKYLVEQKGEKIGSQDLKKKIACFTIQFDKDSGFDESGTYNTQYCTCSCDGGLTILDIAERTAKFLGVDMHFKDMNEAEIAKHFEDSIWHNEHHAWDFGTVGKFALSELPRENGFKVVLSGEGADELFAGYPWFVSDFLTEPDPSSPDLLLQKDDALRQRLSDKAAQDIRFLMNKVGADSGGNQLDPELMKRLNNVSSPYSMAIRLTPREIFTPALQSKYTGADQARKVIDAWSPSAQQKIMKEWHPVHTAMYAWTKCQLTNYILTALGDRCEMAHSIEGRPPFLDHHLADLMGSVPPSLKMHYGPGMKGPDAGSSAWWNRDEPQAAAHFWEKWILREAAKPFITEELYLRRKHPYSAPVLWPQDGPLHVLFKRLLTEENVKAVGFLDWPAVRDALDRAFGEGADQSATRACIIVASFVTLSQRFGVAPAQPQMHSVL
jgi:asparagine synthase (glutamine-hydrolysing)